MGWRTLVIRESEKINLFLNNLEVLKDGKKIDVPIIDLDCVIIESFKCVITTRIITSLSKNKVLLIFCDENMTPECQVNSFAGHHLQQERIRNQISWTQNWKKDIWKEIIEAKIVNQIEVLKLNNKDQKRIEMIYGYLNEVLPGDPSNREAHAAKVYWHELYGSSFIRNNEDFVNSMLNYGYTILRAAFSRAIISKGLHPSISIWHSNKYNAYALADDLMEPFRPIVDNYIYQNFLTRDYFSKNEKTELINILNSEIDFKLKRISLTQAIGEYIDQIIDLDKLEEKKYIYPYASSVKYYEL